MNCVGDEADEVVLRMSEPGGAARRMDRLCIPVVEVVDVDGEEVVRKRRHSDQGFQFVRTEK